MENCAQKLAWPPSMLCSPLIKLDRLVHYVRPYGIYVEIQLFVTTVLPIIVRRSGGAGGSNSPAPVVVIAKDNFCFVFLDALHFVAPLSCCLYRRLSRLRTCESAQRHEVQVNNKTFSYSI